MKDCVPTEGIPTQLVYNPSFNFTRMSKMSEILQKVPMQETVMWTITEETIKKFKKMLTDMIKMQYLDHNLKIKSIVEKIKEVSLRTCEEDARKKN